MVKNKILIGSILTLILLVSGIGYITFSKNARIRIDEDKSTFYVPHATYDWMWTVSGREYGKLYDGSSLMYRDASKIDVSWFFFNKTVNVWQDIDFLSTISLEPTLLKAVRTTPYKRGPIVVDEWLFDASIDDIEFFPISHSVNVINGKGYFYRYEVRDLEYFGSTYKLFEQVSLSFGKNMKVELNDNYRWAWVYKSGIVKAQYDIESDDETFYFRLFDPVEVTLVYDDFSDGELNKNLWTNGSTAVEENTGKLRVMGASINCKNSDSNYGQIFGNENMYHRNIDFIIYNVTGEEVSGSSWESMGTKNYLWRIGLSTINSSGIINMLWNFTENGGDATTFESGTVLFNFTPESQFVNISGTAGDEISSFINISNLNGSWYNYLYGYWSCDSESSDWYEQISFSIYEIYARYFSYAPNIIQYNVTANAWGDITSVYNSTGNLTPTILVNTTKYADGFFSLDNSSWTKCQVTENVTRHTCTIQSDNSLHYYQNSVYFVFNDTQLNNKTYEIITVDVGPKPAFPPSIYLISPPNGSSDVGSIVNLSVKIIDENNDTKLNISFFSGFFDTKTIISKNFLPNNSSLSSNITVYSTGFNTGYVDSHFRYFELCDGCNVSIANIITTGYVNANKNISVPNINYTCSDMCDVNVSSSYFYKNAFDGTDGTQAWCNKTNNTLGAMCNLSFDYNCPYPVINFDAHLYGKNGPIEIYCFNGEDEDWEALALGNVPFSGSDEPDDFYVNKSFPRECFNEYTSNILRVRISMYNLSDRILKVNEFNITGIGMNSSVYPLNVSIDIGNSSIWEYFNVTNGSTRINLNATKFSSVSLSFCNCSGCFLNNNSCIIPVIFYSNNSGIFSISNISINDLVEINISLNNSNGTDITYWFDDLRDKTTYVWRVNVSDGSFNDVSPIWNFSTITFYPYISFLLLDGYNTSPLKYEDETTVNVTWRANETGHSILSFGPSPAQSDNQNRTYFCGTDDGCNFSIGFKINGLRQNVFSVGRTNYDKVNILFYFNTSVADCDSIGKWEVVALDALYINSINYTSGSGAITLVKNSFNERNYSAAQINLSSSYNFTDKYTMIDIYVNSSLYDMMDKTDAVSIGTGNNVSNMFWKSFSKSQITTGWQTLTASQKKDMIIGDPNINAVNYVYLRYYLNDSGKTGNNSFIFDNVQIANENKLINKSFNISFNSNYKIFNASFNVSAFSLNNETMRNLSIYINDSLLYYFNGIIDYEKNNVTKYYYNSSNTTLVKNNLYLIFEPNTTKYIFYVPLPSIYNVTSAFINLTGVNLGAEYVVDPFIDIGNDGSHEWNYSGSFGDPSETPVTINNLSTSFNSYISDCFSFDVGVCLVPIVLSAENFGWIYVDDLKVFYETEHINSVILNTTILNAFLKNKSGIINLPITTYIQNNGILEINDLKLDYYGDGPITVKVQTDESSTEPYSQMNKTIQVRYSNFNVSYPPHIDYWLVEPYYLSQKNVTPFAQKDSVAIFNVTNYAISDAYDIFVKFNQSANLSCIHTAVEDTNTRKLPDASLVAEYSFEVTDNNVARDSTENFNGGTISGANCSVEGHIGRACDFDGINDKISGISDIEEFEEISICSWFNSRDVSSEQDIFETYWDGAVSGVVHLRVYGSGLRFTNTNSTSDGDLIKTNLLVDNNWYHVCVTETNDDVATIYLNGTNVTSEQWANSVWQIENWWIGINNNNNDVFNGTIDEVKIFNKSLSPGEVKNLYNSGSAIYITNVSQIVLNDVNWERDGLVSTYSFDDYSADDSWGENDGVLTNYVLINGKIFGANCSAEGRNGNGCSFDGVSNTINISYVPELRVQPITAMAWVKFKNTGKEETVFSNRMGSNEGWGVYKNTDEQLRSYVGNGSTASDNGLGIYVETDTWYHITYIYDGTGTRVAVNGTLSGTNTAVTGPIDYSNNYPTCIGSYGTYCNAGFINGSVDDVRIWNRTLSATEILAEMNSSIMVNNYKAVLSYDFEVNNHTNVYDVQPFVKGNNSFGVGFDGINDYLDMGSGINMNGNSMSICGWYNVNSDNKDYVILASKDWDKQFQFYVNNYELRFYVKNSSGSTVTATQSGGMTGYYDKWTFLCGTYDGSLNKENVRLYRNGIQLSGNASIKGNLISSADNLYMGKNLIIDAYKGYIDEIRIYDRALSSDEISMLSNPKYLSSNSTKGLWTWTDLNCVASEVSKKYYEPWFCFTSICKDCVRTKDWQDNCDVII